MPAARYWRAIAVDSQAGGDLELSALHVYDAGGRVDAGAALTSTFAPASGALANLQDSDFGTTARFSSAAIAAPSFALHWDFGAPVDVYGVRAGGPVAAEFLKSLTLQYSSDGSAWALYAANLGDFPYPGASALTAAPDLPPWFYSDVGRWQLRTSMNFSAIAMSADGLKLTAGVFNNWLYSSQDAGETWNQIPGSPSGQWGGIVASEDGSKLAVTASGVPIRTSVDGGATLVSRAASGSRSWRGLACSPDGAIIAAGVSPGNIYISTDSGVTWNARGPSASWEDVFISADGTKMAAATYNSGIQRSTDGGVTWATAPGTIGKNWTVIDGSADGVTLLAGAAQTGLEISNDGGATWSRIAALPSTGFGWAVAQVSADGRDMLAANPSGGFIYRSRDGGANWFVEAGAGFESWGTRVAALSTDGRRFAVGSTAGLKTVAFRDPMFSDPPLRSIWPQSPAFFASSPTPDFTTVKLPDAMAWRDMEFSGRGRIANTVKEKNTPVNTPLRRRVRLFRDIDGLLIRETWSDAVTGAYAFLQIDERYTYSVVSYDHLSNYRAVIADHLTPELMP